MPSRPIFIRETIKAAHLILTGYGHWLPNDPRGSGSAEVRKLGLTELGPIHFGRKREQPARGELRAFYRAVEPKLAQPVVWFDEAMRGVIGGAIGNVVSERGYTCWACAVLRNHLHLVMRTHRDDSLAMLTNVADATHAALHAQGLVPQDHPVWSERPYKVYLKTREQIAGRIGYVERNPVKEGLAPQGWDFVRPFAG